MHNTIAIIFAVTLLACCSSGYKTAAAIQQQQQYRELLGQCFKATWYRLSSSERAEPQMKKILVEFCDGAVQRYIDSHDG